MNTNLTTAERLRKAKEYNAKRLDKLCQIETRRNKEREVFLKIQQIQCQPESLKGITDIEDFDVNSPFIRGEFHILFEKNVFCFESLNNIRNLSKPPSEKPDNEHNLYLVSGRSDIENKS